MLLFFTLVIAICWILYELMIWTLSSYLIWNSVQQFSFTIGFFMSGMWIWAYFTRYLEKKAIYNFLKIELFLSVLGASSVIILKLAYIFLWDSDLSFQFIYFFITILLWSLVWVEIPMVAEIYKQLKIKTKSIISDIFTFDYIWGLLASLLFPLVILPYLGLYYVSIFIWSLNLLVAFLYLQYLKQKNKKLKILKKKFFIKYYSIIFLIVLYFIILILLSTKIENLYLKYYFKEPILQTYQTKYQNIVLTKRWDDFRMYLNWNIQFLSLDEHRYHEALVDWSKKLLSSPQPSPKGEGELSVLVLWWWDWLAVRNLLKYKDIKKITLIELDPEMIKISKTQKDMVKLNENSFNNQKVHIIIWDAFKYIVKTKEKYDFIIADFPDPRDVYTSKLYSKEFYASVYSSLKEWWVFVTQSSSSFFATKAFWSIEKTVKNIFGNSLPYHRYLPSFWDWWFVATRKIKNTGHPQGDAPTVKQCRGTPCGYPDLWNIICPNLWCTWFDEDYTKVYDSVKENTLTNPVIIDYYLEGYKKYNL